LDAKPSRQMGQFAASLASTYSAIVLGIREHQFHDMTTNGEQARRVGSNDQTISSRKGTTRLQTGFPFHLDKA